MKRKRVPFFLKHTLSHRIQQWIHSMLILTIHRTRSICFYITLTWVLTQITNLGDIITNDSVHMALTQKTKVDHCVFTLMNIAKLSLNGKFFSFFLFYFLSSNICRPTWHWIIWHSVKTMHAELVGKKMFPSPKDVYIRIPRTCEDVHKARRN